jgi:[ribosomal protein S5]-alanine N-acetyltransferase
VRQRPVSSADPCSPRQRCGLHTLKEATTHDNIASQKVLAKNGFVPIGPAELSGKPGTWYERDLTAG